MAPRKASKSQTKRIAAQTETPKAKKGPSDAERLNLLWQAAITHGWHLAPEGEAAPETGVQ